VDGHRAGSRVRVDHADGDVPRYLTDKGNKSFFFAPGAGDLLKDTTVPVIFVEAEKSALAIASLARRARRTYLIVAIGGVYGWKRKAVKELQPDGGTKEVTGPAPDLDLIHFKDRHVLIAFDSNVATKPEVRKARNAFRKELPHRKAAIAFVEIPAEDDINGPDDFIAVRGDDAVIAAIDDASGDADTLQHLIRNADGTAKGRWQTQSRYCAMRRNGRVCWRSTSSACTPLCANRPRGGRRSARSGTMLMT
jgi:hypothetical protein